jgi:hypothetical protein
MVTRFNLVYSAAAVRRLLGLAADAMVIVREWAFCVWVWVRGQRPQFWSKNKFKQHFADHRKAQATRLSVSRVANFDSVFSVHNVTKRSFYQVYVTADKVVCGCDDYRNQDAFLEGKRRCCKHGYAVLQFLGFNSLREYVGR